MKIRAMGVTIVCGAISMAAPGGSPRAAQMPPVERVELENGLRLLVIEQPHLPMVVMSAVIDAGVRFEQPGQEGLANLTAELLTEGTKKRSAAEFHDAADFLGARISSAAGDDYSSLSLTVLAKDLREGMSLFSESLREPALEEDDFERKKQEALAELEAADQNPSSVADREFRRALFRDGPYRSAPSGWQESVARLRTADVRDFYARAYGPQRTILVVSGGVSMKEIRPLVEEMLGVWKRGENSPVPPEATLDTKPQVLRIDRDLSQANLAFGHLGTTRDDPDWYAITVMNYILGGGGFSSRLMQSVRVEAGLAYSVYSYFRPGKLPGTFQVGLQTKSASTEEALARVAKEIERIRSEPVSEEELASAKRYLTGSFPLKFDSNAEMVGFYSQVEYYGLGLDYPERHDGLINAITQEDVQRVAREYLNPDRTILVVVGKQAEIKLPES